MLERLSRADAQIRAFNQRLAGEIEAATRDLSEKNATLNQLNRLLGDMRRDNASKVRLAALGQLAAQLAHEIGTPLSSVSGHLQLALLQRDLQPVLRDRWRSRRARSSASAASSRLPGRPGRWSPSASDRSAAAAGRGHRADPRRRHPRAQAGEVVRDRGEGAGRDETLRELVTTPGCCARSWSTC